MTNNEQELKQNPAEECIHFDRCAVNCCPLDKNFNNLTFSPFDKEINCLLRRSARRRISRKYNLPVIKIRKRKVTEIKGNKNNKQGSDSPLNCEVSK